ncbi:MAG TPA: hypothetical protein VMF64_11600 [Steroidobacteraceae bacterium]|nr:hypothetical protein [Steroidobacteraceae bacterium]
MASSLIEASFRAGASRGTPGIGAEGPLIVERALESAAGGDSASAAAGASARAALTSTGG